MKNFAVCCTLLGGFVLSFGLVSLFIKEQLYIAETAVATLFGLGCRQMLLKNGMESLLRNLETSSFIFHFSHLVLSLQLVAVGVTVPRVFLRKNWFPLAILLLPVMGIMFAVSTVIIKYVCSLSWTVSMIIGACVTPTDPILASGVLKGKFANKYIPSRFRHMLAVESGANDGMGFPLLVMPILMLQYQNSTDNVTNPYRTWLVKTWGFEILLAIVVGALIGLLARLLLKRSMKKFLIDKESFLVYILALAILVTGITAFIESDDLLAVFVSGVVFAWDEEMMQDMKDSHVLEVVDLIFNQAFFILFGMTLGSHVFTLRRALAAVLIVLFRRLPGVWVMRALGLLPGFGRKETFFTGWFGPIGVGAIFFAYHTQHVLHHSLYTSITQEIIETVYTIVLASIIVHGTTAPVIHLHMRRKQKKGKKEIDVYGSDTEVEREAEMSNNLQQII
ncbi:sodium/hydrogen antiporter [Nematocida sp. AWRm77]|nr:sodium/hydrogen antiporter [Nematocida sp. AWRm77]